jgi:hypothetical protein
LPSHVADINATCFKCGKVGHLKKECKEGKIVMPQSGEFCSRCGVKEHNKAKCWELHPKLKIAGSKGAKTSGSEKEKETKANWRKEELEGQICITEGKDGGHECYHHL